MIKTAVLALAYFGAGVVIPPSVPATAPNPQYPLRVRIVRANAAEHRYDYEGYGRADLLPGGSISNIRGFDYTFSCGQPFLANKDPQEFYQARWKKPNRQIELLLQPVGRNNTQRCTLDVDLKDKPYGTYVTTIP